MVHGLIKSSTLGVRGQISPFSTPPGTTPSQMDRACRACWRRRWTHRLHPLWTHLNLIRLSPITVGTVVTLTATASDTDPGDSITKVTFYEDSNGNGIAEETEIIDSDSDDSDGWSIDWATKFHGTGGVTLLAVAEDSNLLRSDPRTLTVTLAESTGQQNPSVDSFVCDPSSPITVGELVSLTATVSDLDPGDAIAKVVFYHDVNANGAGEDSEIITVDADGTDGWGVLWDTKDLAPALVTLLAIAEDTSLLRSDPQPLTIMFVAPSVNHAPTVDTFDCSPPSPVTIGGPVTLTVTASEPDTG